MISKLDNLTELKKAKTLIELIIEDNPVLVLKDSAEILKTLPLKNKNGAKEFNGSSTNVVRESLSVNSSMSIKKSKEKMSVKMDVNSPLVKRSLAYVNEHLPDINTIEHNKDGKEFSLNNHQNVIFKSEEISQAQSLNIIAHIEKEWLSELDYIIENGYNGYNTKRLKESKIVSGHAELEGTNKLNIFGNALEVLDQEEFYPTITILHFEYFNIDLITLKNIIDKLRNFKNLKKLVFSHNNIHSFYQLIKFEDILDIEAISITNNEINNSTFLKYFLLYRFQNLKIFNEQEITQQDIISAKKVFEYFDKCISHHENKESVESKESKESNLTVKNPNYDIFNLNKKKELFTFIQDNLVDVLEEIIEDIVV